MEYYHLSKEGVNYGTMGDVYQLIHPETKERSGYVSKGVKVSLDSKIDDDGFVISEGEVIICGSSFIGKDSHVIIESGYLENVHIKDRSMVTVEKAYLLAKNLTVENESVVKLTKRGISTRFSNNIFRVNKVLLDKSNLYIEAPKCFLNNINLDDESVITLSCSGSSVIEEVRLDNAKISYTKTTKDFNGETKTILGNAILSDINLCFSDTSEPGIEIIGGKYSNLIMENVTNEGEGKLRIDGGDSVTSIIITDYKLKAEDEEVTGIDKILLKDE